ncbi:MAG: GIY-YIG nuclease family protein [Patescibacteria group bacterium]
MYYVYIIKSLKTGKFYTGFTNDLNKRITEHNRGSSSTISTFEKGPFELVYSEQALDSKEARRREKFFKSGDGRRWKDEYLKTKYIPR